MLPMLAATIFGRKAIAADAARLFHDIGSVLEGLADTPERPSAQRIVIPTAEQYTRAANEAGVPREVIQSIWQIESRQVALLDGKPLIRIEPGKWVQFGGAKRQLPRPLNPGGDTPADTVTGQQVRWENLYRLASIDPVRAIVSASHGGPQIMGYWAEECGFKDERTFMKAMESGPGPQMNAMVRFITHPKNAVMRRAMQQRDVLTISHHWNGPRFRDNRYDEKLAAGIRRFA